MRRFGVKEAAESGSPLFMSFELPLACVSSYRINGTSLGFRA